MIDQQDLAARQARVTTKAYPGTYLDSQLAQLETQLRQVGIGHDQKSIEDDDPEFPRLGSKLPPIGAKRGGPEVNGALTEGKEDVRPSGRIDGSDRDDGSDALQIARPVDDDHVGGAQGAKAPLQRTYSRDALDSESEHGASGEKEWRVVVLDTSALLWAPQGVRRLVRQGWEVIVPNEALRTLDLLKSGSSPSARAARSAARYIEHSSRHHKPFSTDPSIAVQAATSYRRGRGLRLQDDNETRSPDSVSLLPIPVVEGDVLPKWMENILGCAAFFTRVAEAELVDESGIPTGGEAGAILYVANPPLTVEIKEGDTGNIGQRGEGYLVSQEAERFEIPIEVLRDDDAEVEQEFKGKRGGKNRSRQGGGGGGGGGGAGGGGGRGKGRGGAARKPDVSQEREVKILLRRPADNTQAPLQVPQTGEAETIHRSPSLVPVVAQPPAAAPPRPVQQRGGPDASGESRTSAAARGRGSRSRGRGSSGAGGGSGGRGRGGGGRGRGGFHGGEFVMLQRPGPPLATFADGKPGATPAERRGGDPPIVLLQRRK